MLAASLIALKISEIFPPKRSKCGVRVRVMACLLGALKGEMMSVPWHQIVVEVCENATGIHVTATRVHCILSQQVMVNGMTCHDSWKVTSVWTSGGNRETWCLGLGTEMITDDQL